MTVDGAAGVPPPARRPRIAFPGREARHEALIDLAFERSGSPDSQDAFGALSEIDGVDETTPLHDRASDDLCHAPAQPLPDDLRPTALGLRDASGD
jgi:hypothetical protein